MYELELLELAGGSLGASLLGPTRLSSFAISLHYRRQRHRARGDARSADLYFWSIGCQFEVADHGPFYAGRRYARFRACSINNLGRRLVATPPSAAVPLLRSDPSPLAKIGRC